MQKIMMPAKPCCDHAEGSESGLRALELDVGEWERTSAIALADVVKYRVVRYVGPLNYGPLTFLVFLESKISFFL